MKIQKPIRSFRITESLRALQVGATTAFPYDEIERDLIYSTASRMKRTEGIEFKTHRNREEKRLEVTRIR